MPFTNPPTAVTGAIVQTTHRNILRDNDNWFNALLGTPVAADRVPILTSAVGGTWSSQLGASSFGTGSVTTAKLHDGAVTAAAVVDGSVDTTIVDSTVLSYLVPSGLIWMVQTAAEIPSGWSRESNLNGRMPIHAGTTFSVTYVEETEYGSSWGHLHTLALTTSGPNNTVPNLKVGATPRASTLHGHPVNGNSASTSWVIPSRAYVYCRKN